MILNCNPPQSSMQPIIHWMDWSKYITPSISARPPPPTSPHHVYCITERRLIPPEVAPVR